MNLLAKLCAVLVIFSAIPAWATEAEAPLEVEARLLEVPGTMPPNELYNYVYIMKYRVQKVVKGQLQERVILVGHYNPLMARSDIKDKMKDKVSGDLKKIKSGQKHLLKLVPLNTVWQGAVEDEYFDDETSPRYFAVMANLLP